MLEHLIRHLRELGIDMDATSIADSLWLAEIMRSTAPAGTPAENDAAPPPPAEASDQPELERTEPSTDTTNQLGVHSLTPGSAGTRRATKTYISTGRALPQALQLARALRPFKEPFRNGARRELAVDATIDRYVETRLLTPVFDPVPERWFNVDVVVDQSLSMRVWHETVREIVDLLRQTGAFRLVREWHLDAEDQESLLRDINGVPVRPELLRDPQQRRLIVVISDCVSDGWYDSGTWTMLRTWLGSTHTVLLNPLPARLWRHTGLDLPAARLHGSVPGAPSTGLRFDVPAILRLRGNGRWLPLPIAGLSPFSLGQWARTTMAAGQDGCDGVLVPDAGRLTFGEDYDDGPELAGPEELVHAFRMTASPFAWRLAVLCSTQETLPLGVMRLIQHEMLPEAQVADLAEVIVSGLFADATGSSPGEMTVAFVPGVVDVLRKHLSTMDAWSVHDAVSAVLERSAGHGGRAAAAVEHDTGELTLPDHLAPFAHAAAETLRLLEPQVHAARRSRTSAPRPATNPAAGHGRFVGIANNSSELLNTAHLYATRDLLAQLFRTEVLIDTVETAGGDRLSDVLRHRQDGGALVVLWSGHATASEGKISLLSRYDDRTFVEMSLDDFLSACAGSGASQVFVIIDASLPATELDEAMRVIGETVAATLDGGLTWCGLLMSAGTVLSLRAGTFSGRVRRLLRDGPTAAEDLARWSRTSELVDGGAFGLALLREWDADVARPRFVQFGVPMPMLPNPLHPKWQKASGISTDENADAEQSQCGLLFDVLGPLRVRANGEPVALPQGDVRRVLAMLIADANNVVPVDRIKEALSAGRSAVQLHIAALRDLLANADPDGSATIRETTSGYELVVDPWRVDVHHAERLIASALWQPAATRAALLGDALRLWRGVTLADVPDHPDFGRLEELRLTALEDRIEAELELGRRAELADELRQLVTDFPHREHFRTLLAMATEERRYDVAFSSTGEQRSYVQDVVRLLKEHGLRVFYDVDDQDLWGQDLTEYLGSVYRSARLTILFVSEDYARNALDTPERASAFARLMEANEPRVRYVRCDDTALHALPPSAGFADLRWTPSDQLAELIVRKLSRDDDARLEQDDRSLAEVVEQGWERLQHQRREYELGNAVRVRVIEDDLEALNHLLARVSYLNSVVDHLTTMRGPQVALVGNQFVDGYESLLDWATDIRGTQTSKRLTRLYDLAARLVGQPIRQLDSFVFNYVSASRTGTTSGIELTLMISLSDAALAEFEEELSRVRSAAPDPVETSVRDIKPGLTFGVLGPLQVLAGGSLVQLGARNQRRVLAMLVAEANRPVALDDIVAALWRDQPYRAARNSVQATVSRLRRALVEADPTGSATIRATSQGYQLDVDPSRVDAHRAWQLVGSAQDKPAAVRAGLLREALSLWRGPVLDDVPGQPISVELEELRMYALEERIEAELELGRHLELVGELRRLCAEYPNRERLLGLCMRALYRSGRRADALEEYQRFHRRAVGELGIDPGPELRELREQVLQDDPALSVIGASPSRVSPASASSYTVAAVDVEGFGSRDDQHLEAVRAGLMNALTVAFRESGINLEACTMQASGDGVLILVHAIVSVSHFIERLPSRLAAALRRHNAVAAVPATIRLRLALHVGDVQTDSNGMRGAAVIHTYRLLDATPLKAALRDSSSVLAMIVSDNLYRDVIAPDPGAEPHLYRRVDVAVKEFEAAAWIRTVD